MNRAGNRSQGGLLAAAGVALACAVAAVAMWSRGVEPNDAPTERLTERGAAAERVIENRLRGGRPAADEPDARSRAADDAARTSLASRAREGDAPPTDLTDAAALRGRVEDDRGRPVTTASIDCISLDGTSPRAASLDDPTGRFHLDLAPGHWMIEVRAPGHVAATCPVELPTNDALIVTLPRAGRVRGLVLAPDGAPPPEGASVFFVRPSGQPSEGAPEAIDVDATGAFDIELRSAGENRLVARADGYARSLPLAVENVPGGTRDGLILQLRPSGVLECRVVGSTGDPAADAHVVVRAESGAVHVERKSDAQGLARVVDLPAGDYVVYAQHVELAGGFGTQRSVQVEVALVAGATEQVELRLAPQGDVVLVGTVHRGGVPLTGAFVQAERDDGRDFATATDVVEGAFQLTLDGPGDYRLMFLLLDTSAASIERIRVPDVARHEVEIELPSGVIAGTVRGPDGRPVEGVVISLEPDVETGDLSPNASYGESRSDANGAFRFSDLRDGRYELTAPRFSVDPGPFARTRVAGLEVTDGAELGGVDIALTLGSVLEGVVFDAQGKPRAHARVVVIDERGKRLETAAANELGHYEQRALPAGPARAIAFVRDQASAVRPVVLRTDAPTQCDLRLAPMGSVAIRVRERDGSFVGGALRVVDEHGVDFAALLSTEDDERVTPPARLLRVPPGRYVVSAENHSGVRAEQEAVVTPDDTTRVELTYR